MDRQAEAVPGFVRRQRMVELIGEQGFARVSELGEAFHVSEVTVRSDLDTLDGEAVIRRVHGGAVLRTPVAAPERSFEESLETSADEKRSIAAAAAKLVKSGSSVLLDVGTTTSAIARALIARDDLVDVTIITNGLTIALELERAIPRFQVIVTGGSLRPLQHSLVEPLASLVLAGLHADLAFIGCNGVHATAGVTNINLPEAGLKRMMVAHGSRAIVVADGTKIGQIHLGRVAPISDFRGLITGPSADAEALADLAGSGLEITVAA
jgi:DeoR family transcriptional regulator, aga operon transcriptional repressor